MQTFHSVPADQRLDLLKVVAHATPLVQVVMLLLIAASLACAAVWAVRESRGPQAAGPGTDAGLAFLNGVLTIGPLLALATAAEELMHMSLGIANLRPEPGLAALAPGFAEIGLVVFLGLIAAVIAAAARAHLGLTLGARPLAATA